MKILNGNKSQIKKENILSVALDDNGCDGVIVKNPLYTYTPKIKEIKTLADVREAASDIYNAAAKIKSIEAIEASLHAIVEVQGSTEKEILTSELIGYNLASHNHISFKKDNDDKRRLSIILKGVPRANKAIEKAAAISNAIKLSIDISNMPGNVCTPFYFCKYAAKNLASTKNLTMEVIAEADLIERGMGGLLSVGRGSEEKPKMLVVRYEGHPGKNTIGLVGKGITFDSGGISLKPGSKMDEMKFDMCGGGNMLGVIHAVAAMNLKVNILLAIPLAENMPGVQAYKPGDVITMYDKQTVEVINTDAEGRIVLGDALALVAEDARVDKIINMATLTGAIVASLGDQMSGLFSNNDSLAESLIQKSVTAGEEMWRMPLNKKYQEDIDSKIADMKNLGDGRCGAITAACFLERFVKEKAWAHIDIAGVAWGKNRKLTGDGATGNGIITLVEWLIEEGR